MTGYYNIYRYYNKLGKKPKLQATGLTLEKAQEWCNDPETSSKTATKKRSRCRYEWFDGYSRY